MSKTVQITNTRALRSEIVVDDKLNSRKTIDDAKVQKLADSIKTQGVIHPPLLIRTTQVGDKYAKKGNYLLVAGFRRQMAMDRLGMEEGDYRLAPADWTLEDALAANLTENLSREDLAPYEVAAQCAELKTEYGMTAADIAKKVKAHDSDPEGKSVMSESHINNLIRCATELHPQILKAWKEGHPRASMRTLIKLVAEKDTAKQLEAWKGITEPAVKKGKDGKDEKKGKGGKGPARPSAAILAIAIQRIKEAAKEGKRDEQWAKGAIAALQFAQGVKETIPGVKLDAPAKEAPKSAKEDPEGEDDDGEDAEGEGEGSEG